MTPAYRSDPSDIARRAYALWEKEGRPHGRDRDHWSRAERELDSELALAAAGEPAESAKTPARTRKTAAAAAAEATVKPARRKSAKPA
jgi:DUF2934 family protein